MNHIALVSANFGGIDMVKPLPSHDGIDAFYYTDTPASDISAHTRDSWTKTINPDYPAGKFPPRLRSHFFKHQIHRLDEVRGHRWLVWADSSLLFLETDFILGEIDKMEKMHPSKRVLVVPHPHRGTITQERDFIDAEMAKGNGYLIERYGAGNAEAHFAWMRDNHMNTKAPLYAVGFWIIENTPETAAAWDSWWYQNIRFRTIDQYGLPPTLQAHGFEPQKLDVNIFHNQHFIFVAHQK